MNDLPISKVLRHYDTDKVRGHCYGESYNKLFAKFDRTAPLNILEVGTQKGGSLLAWKEFFPNSTVTGVDIVDVVLPEYRKDTVRRVVADIKDWATTETFDIIIDDGSHFFEDVMFVIRNYVRRLRPNGLMVIEDVQDQNWLRHIQVPFETIDLRQINGNYDDFLIVIHG